MPRATPVMTTYQVTCQNPNHANNSAYPGWDNGIIATVAMPGTTQPTGYQCDGCKVASAPPPDPPA